MLAQEKAPENLSSESQASLSKLRSFLSHVSSETDPYWQTILQSDIRNIIPKHEVCKIQLVKNSLSKTRLIMENLNTFISLEVQKKHLKQEMIDLNQNVTNQFQALLNPQIQSETDKKFQYDTALMKRKKQLEIIAKQLSKSKTSNELKLLIQRNKKWQKYIEKHVKQLEKAQESEIHSDIMNLIETWQELFEVDSGTEINEVILPSKEASSEVILRSGNWGKLYENKMEQKILITKLLDSVFDNSNLNNSSSDQDDYWNQEVLKIRKIHEI